LKQFGKIDIGKQFTWLWKFLVVFVVVNILGIISTIWSPALSPKYRSIDRAVASLNIPADWEVVPLPKDSRMPEARDYLGSCRFVELFDSGPCVTNSHLYKATFNGDPRDAIKSLLKNSTILRFENQSEKCGFDEKIGVGGCTIIVSSGNRGFYCSIGLPVLKDGTAKGFVSINCYS
jgi:hypothetical protein